MNKSSKAIILTAIVLLFIGVILGAMGAHALKNIVTPEKMLTFETGIRYHFYHALALLLLGLANEIYSKNSFKMPFIFFLSGILFFSFNCYFYAVTSLKFFAMFVPVGGFLFLFGWLSLFVIFFRMPRKN